MNERLDIHQVLENLAAVERMAAGDARALLECDRQYRELIALDPENGEGLRAYNGFRLRNARQLPWRPRILVGAMEKAPFPGPDTYGLLAAADVVTLTLNSADTAIDRIHFNPYTDSLTELLSRLPEEFEPDLFWDVGIGGAHLIPSGLEEAPFVTAAGLKTVDSRDAVRHAARLFDVLVALDAAVTPALETLTDGTLLIPGAEAAPHGSEAFVYELLEAIARHPIDAERRVKPMEGLFHLGQSYWHSRDEGLNRMGALLSVQTLPFLDDVAHDNNLLVMLPRLSAHFPDEVIHQLVGHRPELAEALERGPVEAVEWLYARLPAHPLYRWNRLAACIELGCADGEEAAELLAEVEAWESPEGFDDPRLMFNHTLRPAYLTEEERRHAREELIERPLLTHGASAPRVQRTYREFIRWHCHRLLEARDFADAHPRRPAAPAEHDPVLVARA